ncbi:MAG: GNAT family protein [Halanaerobiales bacterium]|nr:GNAT family protein [Halanaerobiales bacterium]
MEFIKKINAREVAEEIANWKYKKPYNIYNINGDENTIKEIIEKDYYSYSYGDIIIGYFCYGKPARVPNDNNDIYEDENYLDIGIGMNPKLCDKGKGLKFFKKAVETAYELYEKKKYRLTVAKFNERAIKVYKKYGFKEEKEFVKNTNSSNTTFITMLYN